MKRTVALAFGVTNGKPALFVQVAYGDEIGLRFLLQTWQYEKEAKEAGEAISEALGLPWVI